MAITPTTLHPDLTTTREQQISRLVELGFAFQRALLDHVHNVRRPIVEEYTRAQAERLADELQYLCGTFDREQIERANS